MINNADTAFILISAALVMLMTPGLALYYGGLVRSKNVLGTIMQSFLVLGLVTVVWVLWGYSLAFGPDRWGIIGGLDWFALNGVDNSPSQDYAATIPHLAFMIYQAMFAIITPALITGAFAERMKFSSFFVMILLWATFVYSPVAHWVWGVGGWIRNLGALDFAGGTVVHVSSAASALAAALLVGKRKGYGLEVMPPHNLPLTIIGVGLLWFGWFGFNAGSALASGALSTQAFVTTHVAAATAALAWTLVEWYHRQKPTTLGIGSGAIAGLVAITPAAGFVTPSSALIIGLGAGIFCYFGILLKTKMGYDDSLDVVGIHGIGGTWGALATGLFATQTVNEAGSNGLFYGNPAQLGIQFIAVLATWIYAFIVTLLILLAVRALMGLRVSEDNEERGLDLTQHSETGYNM